MGGMRRKCNFRRPVFAISEIRLAHITLRTLTSAIFHDSATRRIWFGACAMVGHSSAIGILLALVFAGGVEVADEVCGPCFGRFGLLFGCDPFNGVMVSR